MAIRPRCESRIFDDRSMLERPVDSVAVGSSVGVRTVCPVVSWAIMIDLLSGGSLWEPLSDHAAKRQECPLAIGLGEGLPELRQCRPLTWLQRARGGTDRDRVSRTVFLRV